MQNDDPFYNSEDNEEDEGDVSYGIEGADYWKRKYDDLNKKLEVFSIDCDRILKEQQSIYGEMSKTIDNIIKENENK